MINSDIIAIIAVLSSLITSVVTVVFAYMTSRQNIRAERSKIAYEKRIDAIKIMYGVLSRLSDCLITYCNVQMYINKQVNVNDAKIETRRDNLGKETDKFQAAFYKAYYDNRVYIPTEIDDLIQGYMKFYTSMEISDETTESDMNNYIAGNRKHITTIIGEIHKFIEY